MKKIKYLLVAAMLSFSLLAGCESEDPDDDVKVEESKKDDSKKADKDKNSKVKKAAKYAKGKVSKYVDDDTLAAAKKVVFGDKGATVDFSKFKISNYLDDDDIEQIIAFTGELDDLNVDKLPEMIEEKALKKLKDIAPVDVDKKEADGDGGEGDVDVVEPDIDDVPEPDSANMQTFTFEWHDETYKMQSITVDIDMDAYERCFNEPRVMGYFGRYDSYYIKDEDNVALINAITKEFIKLQEEKGWSDMRTVKEIINFSQDCVTYEYDSDGKGVVEYPKYPIETLVEGKGDCEDSAMVMAAITKRYGVETALLVCPGHMTVALALDGVKGTYFEMNGMNYYYVEATGYGYEPGDVPQGVDLSTVNLYRVEEY